MSLRHGLPFGWWRSTDVWAAALSILGIAAVGLLLLGAWFL